jgi:two-component system chemotaxis response regulator CheB
MIRVLIVDDSAVARKMLTQILSSDKNIEVVGTAPNAELAKEKISFLKPDVLTLDIEMPNTDGLTFLKHLMSVKPMPVIMVSGRFENGSDETKEALDNGAIDALSIPKSKGPEALNEFKVDICDKVKVASMISGELINEKIKTHVANNPPSGASLSKISRSMQKGRRNLEDRHHIDSLIPKINLPPSLKGPETIICIGASTGGTEALKKVIEKFPVDFPAVVVTQHIPKAFSKPFSERLDRTCAIKVVEAEEGMQIERGCVYIAPGDKHLAVSKSGRKYICQLNDGRPINRHKPSVDVMFRTALQAAGSNLLGIILTGMGDDGAVTLKEMRDFGIKTTIVQDRATCVVWGMPGAAYKIGAAEHMLPLDKIADKIYEYV